MGDRSSTGLSHADLALLHSRKSLPTSVGLRSVRKERYNVWNMHTPRCELPKKIPIFRTITPFNVYRNPKNETFEPEPALTLTSSRHSFLSTTRTGCRYFVAPVCPAGACRRYRRTTTRKEYAPSSFFVIYRRVRSSDYQRLHLKLCRSAGLSGRKLSYCCCYTKYIHCGLPRGRIRTEATVRGSLLGAFFAVVRCLLLE